MLQVLRDTLGAVIIPYSGEEVFLTTENLIEKSVSEISQLFCQRCSANLREKE